jgi:hypothetical protein
MIKKIASVLTGGILLLYGCYNDKEEILYGNTSCEDLSTSFATNINPIIQSNCAIPTCHAAGSTNGPGPLTTNAQMPKNGSLTNSQIKTISCWVDSGAPNN